MQEDLTAIKAFFTDRRRRCLSVSNLEKEAGLAGKTLHFFLTGQRLLSADAIDKLTPVLVDFGYRPPTDNIL